MVSVIALVVAAGRGTRMGGDRPKQYLPLAGRPLLRHTLEALLACPAVGAVRVVYHPEDDPLYREAVAGLDLLPPVAGGEARQDSVRLGLESLVDLAPDQVLIHDAARPFIAPALIARILGGLDAAPGAIPALPILDTVKRGAAGVIAATLDRTHLWRAQTPQGFHFPSLREAHARARGSALPDDAAVMERAGHEVRLVEGSEENFKVTTPQDLIRAEALLYREKGDSRTGFGFDVHAFGPGDHVWLCGIAVPHEQGLIGHSDADVGLHALTDAILGGIGAGDIGMHFPPGDPLWRGAPSHRFLRHAQTLVHRAGGLIAHVDVTLICERPKIGPHREAMVASIAGILSLERNRVSVKATTTEGLGFTGRREGIAAQAVATLRLP
ncbi:MAG TPA: bifunctional 2-C-methyl-D-erythritol 4-phosphate cytidylyltransferase/2-C-methyl-D-erythritol 2,4-cyclodiphosphate synthase [Stellaceae bacterium]|nr:bifunctional 2-C-methyl-D-erythritol 4-phosphate cytidylyltransferase/2-C-methyl-D-erythritol 2,4-cyclodiphosphate synthase [Stellaceae bacterium]